MKTRVQISPTILDVRPGDIVTYSDAFREDGYENGWRVETCKAMVAKVGRKSVWIWKQFAGGSYSARMWKMNRNRVLEIVEGNIQ